MCKLKKTLSSFLLGITLTGLSAQEFNPYKNVTYPSPTAIQFQKFVDSPVGLYTGTAPISIPIYAINAGEVNLPIELIYHSSGIRLNEHASWVGAGWSLNAGGLITRTVNGLPDFEYYIDDLNNSFTATSDPNLNQPQNGQTAQQNLPYYDLYEVSQFPGMLDFDKRQYAEDVLQSERDAQPDVYYFHFLDLKGKFFIDQDGSVIANPNDKIRISTPNSSNQYFVITDNSGTKYTFGSVTNSRELSKAFKNLDYISSWYLDKIETVGGNTINFTYTVAGSFTYVPDIHAYNYQAEYTRTSGGGPSTANITYSKNNEFKPVKLTKITFNGNTGSGRVDFTSTQTRNDSYQSGSYLAHYRLDEIIVKQENNTKVFRFDLDYDNLSNNLWLTSVTKNYYNDAGTSIAVSDQPYEFTYYNHSSLPSSKTYSIDYWGYYNGQSNGSTLLPKIVYNKVGTSTSYGSGATRTANSTLSKYGVLTEIRYPYGSIVSFDYEPNSFSGFSGTGAGLRLQKTTIQDQLGSPDMVTTYQYINPDNGNAPSGTLLAPLFTASSVVQHYVFNTYSNANVRTSHPLNLGGYQGVGYGTVVVQEGANGENGRTVYHFENAYPDISSQTTAAGYQNQMLSAPYYFNSNLNGKPKKIQVQKKSGSSYSTLTETEYTYNLQSESLKTDGFIGNAFIGTTQNGGISATLTGGSWPGGWTDFTGYIIYKFQTNWFKLNQITSKNHENGSYFTTTTELSYYSQSARELKSYISKKEITYPDGRIIETDYTYPFGTVGTAYSTMTTNHQQPTLTEHTYWRESTSYHHIGGNKKVYASITSNNEEGAGSITRPLLTELHEVKKESNTNSSFNTKLIRKINAYNYHGRIVEEEDANGITTSYIYFRNTLLAKVYNAQRSEVYFENYEYGLSPGEVNNPSVAFTGSSYGTALGSSVGTTNKWLTYWQRISSTWTYQKVTYTGQVYTLSGPFDDVRIFPKDAQMISYSYKPLIGASSESDINNRPSIYVYDNRRELEAIMDHYGNVIKAFKVIRP